jgi:GDP-mannose 6-dehydrogenase
MRVSVFGLGYVGTVTAACLARARHEVIGVDVNADKVAMIQGGQSPVLEPGLGELVAQTTRAGRLRATVSVEEAVAGSDLALVCVGTPGRRSGAVDFGALHGVSQAIGQAVAAARKAFTVAVRSTVPPGTAENLVRPALVRPSGADAVVRVAVNPEFMREGSSLSDFARPPFTLVGCDDPSTGAVLRALYTDVGAPFVETSFRNAEMIKYVANAYHALKVCFANEIGDVCTAYGADPHEVLRTFSLDRQLSISDAYLKPGFAFGGSCLPKDVRALVHAARSADLPAPLLQSILPSNQAQLQEGIDAVIAAGRRAVGIVGLAFKPGTDDLRESPMITLAEALLGKGYRVRILDGNVAVSRLVGANRRYIEEQIPHLASLMCDSVADLLAHAEVVVLGNAGAEAREAAGALGPHHLAVDLTRGALPVVVGARPGAAA